MKSSSLLCLSAALSTGLFSPGTWSAADTEVTRYVDMVTQQGTITVGLYGKAAPITTDNFLAYVNAGLYNNTIINRLDPGFVFLGGYIDIYGVPIKTFSPIVNEAGTSGLSNSQGTLAMARASEANSATSQFFFNLADNSAQLDYGSQNAPAGYAVFGSVIQGQAVMEAIAGLTPFNASALPFPVTPEGAMVRFIGTYPYAPTEAIHPRLRVIVQGQGSVRSQPGKTCRSGTCTSSPKLSQKITLTATQSKGSFFSGWSGDCRGGDRKTQVTLPAALPASLTCMATFSQN